MTDFSCLVGDTLKLRLQVYTSAAHTAVMDLTGKEVDFHAADRAVNPLVSIDKSIGDGIVVPSLVAGAVEITVSSTDTALFGEAGGVLLYYIRLTDGVEVYTLDLGKIKVKRLPA